MKSSVYDLSTARKKTPPIPQKRLTESCKSMGIPYRKTQTCCVQFEYPHPPNLEKQKGQKQHNTHTHRSTQTRLGHLPRSTLLRRGWRRS